MVNGERLKQARELRGFTQTELATRLNISQSAIAQMEAGFIQPSDELLTLLSGILHFPVAFFQQDGPIAFPLGSLLFRARSATTAMMREKAHRYGQLLFELAERLSQLLQGGPQVVLPHVTGSPAEPLDPDHAADITRTAMGLSPDTPIDHLIASLEQAGVLVLTLPESLKGIDAYATWAGTSTGTGDRKPVIILTRGVPGDRLRWSLAHELGHLVMHQPPQGTPGQIEKEADRFAAEFLMPEIAMRQELIPPLTLTAFANLKLRWKVSMQALIRRAHDLTLLTDRQYQYLFEQLSARGWRTREPANLDVEIERPRALRQMVEILDKDPSSKRVIASLFEQFEQEEWQGIVMAYEGPESDDLSAWESGDVNSPSAGNVLPFARRR